MSEYDPDEYSYDGLCAGTRRNVPPSLIYLISLVDRPDHEAKNATIAHRVLIMLHDIEEQVETPEQLLTHLESVLPRRLFPQTPCMATKGWSPIAALLQQGFEPVVLSKDPRVPTLATGIWRAFGFESDRELSACETSEQLFWSILGRVFRRAKERSMFVNVIAMPGWGYETSIDSLPAWSEAQIESTDRILWRRTPECSIL